ncbi:hypothetical protein BC941DRAFT_140769 [Chlamydoabsidia padenii]|nr:hypothetical protein BC941DRAFT_140769 [Chlamydoabsidia padenii]
MGVQGLWQLLSPVARPVQLESLRNRKLAIDASIWIHQFMRTMRSEDGSALRSGHTLGFFRRICKLLFYNIKPVFVFDGGAPTLKRSTIRERRKRRQGVKLNIKHTAEKILKAQMKAQLLKEEEKRRLALQAGDEPFKNAGDSDDEDYVYLEQLDNTAAIDTLRHQNAIKQDQYELPPMEYNKPLEKKTRNKLDPRLATDQELQDFIDEFKPSDIDMDSSVFQALPTEIQYEIIQDVKLKSRQTSWARLDHMVRQSKTPLDFSKQQILQLKHRNEMTQRAMQMNDVASKSRDISTPTRIASERGKEYLLVKNENLDDGLGWKLPGVKTKQEVSPEEEKSTIKADRTSHSQQQEQVLDDDDDDIDQETGMLDPMDDPVARAVANNPRLAALMGDFGNDDSDNDYDNQLQHEYDIDSSSYNNTPTMYHHDHIYYENTDEIQQTNADNYSASGDQLDDDDTPLFTGNLSHQKGPQYTGEWDNRDAQNYESYDGTARKEILSKMYNGYLDDAFSTSSQQYSYDSNSSSNPQESANDQTWEYELDADDFYKLWRQRAPDAFIYMYSFNDQYISILKNALSDNCTINDLEQQLKLVQKVFGKSNDNDRLTHDAYLFHQCFLENALVWKKRLMDEESRLEKYKETRQQRLDSAEGNKMTDSTVLLDEIDADGEYDDIQLAESVPNDSQQSITLPQHTDDITNLDTTPPEHITSKVLDSSFLSSAILPPPLHTGRQGDVPDSNNKTGLAQHVESSGGQTDVDMHSSSNKSNDNNDNNDMEVPPAAIYSSGNESDGMNDNNTEEPPAAIFSSGNESDGMDDNSSEEPLSTMIKNGPEAHMMVDTGYNSDEELTGTVAEENAEFARFMSDIASRDIGSVQQELVDDMNHLNKQQVKQMGNADTVTDQMVQDIQELLQLFGVPYVVSPMEAEAQCAYLLEHDLVDGVVTDDSDVFLFGGSRIYKNMFSQEKYVECYLLQDIDREMHLDRAKLIQLAYFLGSDYTPGLPGIGYVSAMEILAAFQNADDDSEQSLEGPLLRFKQWYDGGVDNTDFEKKFRQKHKHLDIPPDFPNPLVKEAYLGPMLDTSLEQFSWSPPQLDSLRLYLMKSFSWSEEKTDEILVPVIREMNQRQAAGVQSTISSFFDPSAGLQSSYTPSGTKRKHKSKRVQKVVKKLGNRTKAVPDGVDDSSDSSDSNTQPKPVRKSRRKRTTK